MYTVLETLTNKVICIGSDNEQGKLNLNEGETILIDIQPPNGMGDCYYNPDTKSFYQKDDQKANVIRLQRNELLASTDWTQVGDSTHPGSKSDWLTYRTALRDITKQEGFPDSVTWPTPPE